MSIFKCPKCGNNKKLSIKFRIGEIHSYLDFDLYVSLNGDFKDIFFSPVITLTQVHCCDCKYEDDPKLFKIDL